MKRISRISVLIALATSLSIIESFIPIYNGMIPGIKLGLANVAILLTLYIYGFREAFFVSVMRVFIVGMIRTGLFNSIFLFSLSGAILSAVAMSGAKKTTKLSIVGVSVVGSLFHAVGQIIIAAVLIDNANVFYYLPWILLFSLPAGIIIGKITDSLQFKLEKSLIL